jgi:hypothetical protein
MRGGGATRTIFRTLGALLAFAAAEVAHAADDPPLLDPAHARVIAAEVSGSAAKRTVQAMSLHHRMRGSDGYRRAAELVRDRLKEAGLAGIEMISLPADGKVFYGTQRSRPGWNARFAELWEQKQQAGRWRDDRRVASWADQPLVLAQDSVSGRAEAELVDIGAGTSPDDYRRKALRGKLVLTSSQPEAVADLAVGQHGAAGIVSWAQNQRQGWWGEDQSLIRWGHLNTFGKHPTFGFMVSPARARGWIEKLRRGESVRLRAEVEAGREPSSYLIPTALIPGRDRTKEIVFSCHLDHPSPGANDNASGCSGILEVARSLHRLVKSGALPQPERSIRFIWPCEIECTIALLNARPEFAKRTLATIHLDMIGGNTEITKGTLKVEGSPPSLPSFVSDVGFAIARWVDDQSSRYANEGEAAYSLIEEDGTRTPLRAQIGGFSEGSDHQVWAEGSWRIPVIYLADWPDIYIHTNKDVPGNLDSTKMKRAIFIAAGSAWALANIQPRDVGRILTDIDAETNYRVANFAKQLPGMGAEGAKFGDHHRAWTGDWLRSFERFGMSVAAAAGHPRRAGGTGPVYRRSPKLKGPMNGFGYSWLDDQLAKARLPRPALLSRAPSFDGPSFGYETLNLVDGVRTVQQIRDELAATVGPAPVDEVTQYLATLARLGAIEPVR